MGRNHLCEQAIPKDPAHLLHGPCGPRKPSGLSFGFPRLSPSRRQLDYVLLARPPLYSPCGFRVRLACLIHAANVRSEPGSNPSLEVFIQLFVASPANSHPIARSARRRAASPSPGRSRLRSPVDAATSATASLTRFFSRPPRMSKITSFGTPQMQLGRARAGEGSELRDTVKHEEGFLCGRWTAACCGRLGGVGARRRRCRRDRPSRDPCTWRRLAGSASAGRQDRHLGGSAGHQQGRTRPAGGAGSEHIVYQDNGAAADCPGSTKCECLVEVGLS